MWFQLPESKFANDLRVGTMYIELKDEAQADSVCAALQNLGDINRVWQEDFNSNRLAAQNYKKDRQETSGVAVNYGYPYHRPDSITLTIMTTSSQLLLLRFFDRIVRRHSSSLAALQRNWCPYAETEGLF